MFPEDETITILELDPRYAKVAAENSPPRVHLTRSTASSVPLLRQWNPSSFDLMFIDANNGGIRLTLSMQNALCTGVG